MKLIALSLLKLYKLVLSPYMPGQCRFHPTCSEYAAEAVETHGVLKGVGLTVTRLGRCRPGAAPGFDPVPEPKESSAG